MAIIDLLAYRLAAIFLALISLPFLYASLSFPSCLARTNLNSLLSLRGRNYSETIPVVLPTNFAAYRPNRPGLHFLPNDLIGSHLNGGHLEISSINNQRTARVFIRFLAYFPEANLSSTSLASIFWKYSKTFHQQPENIQRLFRLQNCLSRKPSTIFRIYSKTFWAINSSNQQQQSTAPISNSNQQQRSTAATSSNDQQQQPAAAISNSNQQQQQSTAATSSSNQQQQPAAAINSSNQYQQSTAAFSSNNQLSSYQQHLHNPRRLPLVSITVPSRGYVLLEVDLGLAAQLRVQPPLPRLIFVIFHFPKIPFL